MKRIIFLCSFLGVLIMSSCCVVSPCQESNNVIFTATDSGSLCKVKKGETITILLKGNPTTGYTWNIVNYNKKVLKLVGTSFTPDSKLIGASGIQTFNFSVIEKGESDLVLQYSRVWETSEKELNYFKLNIVSE